MSHNKYILLFLGLPILFLSCSVKVRSRIDFTEDWKSYLCDNEKYAMPECDDTAWRSLNLPHDWSIEGSFSKDHPAKINGGALPTGTGWYRKHFTVDNTWKDKQVFIDFDGIYRNSEVWINGHHLGNRPSGYASFRYELTPYLRFKGLKNLIAVRVDNSLQPDSRWFTGSGI